MRSPDGFYERDSLILSYCISRNILHLGCIGETDAPVQEKIKKREDLLHSKVANVAQELYGIDLDHIAIEQYKKLNIPNLYTGNVEELDKIDLKLPFKTFDVVLFTDLLEHISNPGLALEGLKKFIDEDSKILITVPHAFGLLNFIWYSVGVFEEGLQHVSMYNIAGLTNLLERHGYYVVRYCTCYEKRPSSIYFAYSFLRLFPKFGGTIFIEARLRRCGS